jgi:hypothetical protein
MKLIAALLLVAATATTAAADDAKPEAATATDLAAQDCARAKKLHKQCVLSFGAEDIEGSMLSPGGSDIQSQGTTTFASLIHLRYDFRAEIIKAAEDL